MTKINQTRNKYIKLWIQCFPKNPTCEICNKELSYFSGNQNKSACFDHKKEGLMINKRPCIWARENPPTPKNLEIWNKCDFGILCKQCNVRIPSKNREEWISKMLKYVFKKQLKSCDLQLQIGKIPLI